MGSRMARDSKFHDGERKGRSDRVDGMLKHRYCGPPIENGHSGPSQVFNSQQRMRAHDLLTNFQSSLGLTQVLTSEC